MDTIEKATTIIREVLQNENVQVEQIFLFGSRARGTSQPDSDWDLYVLTDRELTFAVRQRLTTKIKRNLAKLRIPNDILLKSSQKFHETKEYSGHLAYVVAQEGIPV
jgi:predicted nucleotidyltransferase